MKVTFIPIVIGTIGTVTKALVQRLEELEKNRMSGDYPNYSIVKIDQNTAKNPGDWRRLAITQTFVKDHQLTLMWKTLQKQDNDYKPCERTEKTMEHKSDDDRNYNFALSRVTNRLLIQGVKELKIKGEVETIRTTAL